MLQITWAKGKLEFIDVKLESKFIEAIISPTKLLRFDIVQSKQKDADRHQLRLQWYFS
jgi:hypothetical protein